MFELETMVMSGSRISRSISCSETY